MDLIALALIIYPTSCVVLVLIATAIAGVQRLHDHLQLRHAARVNAQQGLPTVEDVLALADAVGVLRDLPQAERAAALQAMDEAADLDDANIAAAIDAWRAAQ